MESKSLREKRFSLVQEMNQINELARKENRNLTSEETEKWDKMNADVDTMKQRIDQLERMESLEAEMATQKNEVTDSRNDDQKYTDAFRKYVMRGMGGLNSDDKAILETRVQGVTGNKGGFTIPTGFSGKLHETMKDFSGMMQVSNIWATATGNDVAYPTVNDTSVVGYQINESTDFTTSATDVTFAAKTFKAWKWTSGMLKVSDELMQDSAFNFESILGGLFGKRLGRGLNAAFTTGAGTTTIQGVTVGAGDSGVTPAKSAITRANILDLIHSVDVAYRNTPNTYLMFNDSTLKAIRTLTDQDLRPLYQVSPIVGEPDTIEGYKFMVNSAMPSIGTATNRSMVFGDFSNYVIRQVAGEKLVVLTERFADTGEVGMVLISRWDGQVLDSSALKYWKHLAT